MNWQRSTSGAKKVVLYMGNAEGSNEEALQELWRLILSDILPLNPNLEWDNIKLEIWPDSGRIIAFPASSQSRFRVEMAVCQIFFPLMLQAYEEIDAEGVLRNVVDEQAEERFCEAISNLEKEWVDKLEIAARVVSPNKRGLNVKYFSSDDSDPICETVV